MPPAARTPSAYGQDVPLRRRTAALLIAIAINLLILVMLLTLTPAIEGVPHGQGRTITFDLAPDRQKAASRAAPARQATVRPAARAPTPLPPVIVPVPPKTSALDKVMVLSRQDYAAADIGKLPAQAEAGSGAAGGAGSGDSAAAPGAGPNGEPLYNAEWYREPTDAELAFYRPKNGIMPGSWAMIACQTVARFHVDNCVPLGDSPAGSHLAQAMLQAAWQFLVRPPRVGGKALVGSWVRIKITFSDKGKE